MAAIINGQKIYAVDPYDCGCTECIVGEYVPLVSMDEEHLRAVVNGKMSWHADDVYEVILSYHNDHISVTFTTYKYHSRYFHDASDNDSVSRTLSFSYNDALITDPRFHRFLANMMQNAN